MIFIRKRFSEIKAEYPDLQSVESAMKNVSTSMRELKEKNYYLHYAAAAHRKGFAVGDVVANWDASEKLEVVKFSDGMFWGKPMDSRKTKLVPIYDGWTRFQRRAR